MPKNKKEIKILLSSVTQTLNIPRLGIRKFILKKDTPELSIKEGRHIGKSSSYLIVYRFLDSLKKTPEKGK